MFEINGIFGVVVSETLQRFYFLADSEDLFVFWLLFRRFFTFLIFLQGTFQILEPIPKS